MRIVRGSLSIKYYSKGLNVTDESDGRQTGRLFHQAIRGNNLAEIHLETMNRKISSSGSNPRRITCILGDGGGDVILNL